MIILLVMFIVLAIVCWGLCELISTFVGVLFILAGMMFLVKMTKHILK